MRHPRMRALHVPLTIAALALGGAALPAHADDATLKLSGPSAVAVDPAPSRDGAPGAYLELKYQLSNSQQSKWAVLTLDTSGLKGIADVKLNDSSCTTAGTTITCPQVSVGPNGTFTGIQLFAAHGGTFGSTGTLHASAHLQNSSAVTSADTAVTLGGTRLKVNDLPQKEGLKPGDTWTPDVTVTNNGQLAATQLVFTLFDYSGLELKSRFSNCEYGTSDDHLHTAVCTVNSSLAPGETVHLDPIQLGVTSEAYYAYEDVSVRPSDPGPDSWERKHFHFTPGSGPRLTVGKPETAPPSTHVADLNPNGGEASLGATVSNTADFSAFGAWAPDASGKKGKLTVGMASSGPAYIEFRSGSDPAEVFVTLPKQVKVTDVPKFCRPDTSYQDAATVRYRCSTWPGIRPGYQISYDFTVQTDGVDNPTAQIALLSYGEDIKPHPMPWDPNPKNDSLTVALGSTPSGSIPTASPSTPPVTGKPSQSASATPVSATGSSPATAASTGAGLAGSSAAGGNLAHTGSDGVGVMAGVGAAAIALGGALFVVARRRKAGAHQ